MYAWFMEYVVSRTLATEEIGCWRKLAARCSTQCMHSVRGCHLWVYARCCRIGRGATNKAFECAPHCLACTHLTPLLNIGVHCIQTTIDCRQRINMHAESNDMHRPHLNSRDHCSAHALGRRWRIRCCCTPVAVPYLPSLPGPRFL